MKCVLVLGILVSLITLAISFSIASGENVAASNATANLSLTNETQNETINATNVTMIEFKPLDLPKANRSEDTSQNGDKSRKECPCHSRG
jgi:hypothetical protein